ncbi:MAG: hypothetical protein CMF96_12345 [Candidatus Marinimicrobia bacterium]|nr:hypothetical protein [Candidatus Neomarinimicrobiota bacterium]|tara:strand:+ start:122 stop:1225 length:1104 start_codon:yes stop_codon:yes gene_type:complete
MYNVTTFKRLKTAYFTISKTFGKSITPIFTGFSLLFLKFIVKYFNILDKLFYPKKVNDKLKNPILIVGNPRSGTTFLQRFLSKNFGTGSELWEMIFPSIVLQKLLKPILPLLEKYSPTKHHSTDAHKTSLSSVETDDASILFRYNDGFFLYGFILAWAEQDLFSWFDPKQRNMSHRDFDWLSKMWSKKKYKAQKEYYFGKLFSVSANMPEFQNYFPQGKVLYMIRDPLQVIPSGLSLVTGVLDKKFGFWNQPKDLRKRYLSRLYNALKELLIRFHEDWINNKIDKSKVKIVTFDRLMNDFDNLMFEILEFLEVKKSKDIENLIKETAKKQKNFKSNHKYDLEKFNLTENQIKNDCERIYLTFLNGNF